MEKEKIDFEKACAIMGKDPAALPNVSSFPERLQKKVMADFKLDMIYEAWPADAKSDLVDTSEWKHWPAGVIQKDPNHPSGFGFSYSIYGLTLAYAVVGSRFAFKDENDAMRFVDENPELCQDATFVSRMEITK